MLLRSTSMRTGVASTHDTWTFAHSSLNLEGNSDPTFHSFNTLLLGSVMKSRYSESAYRNSLRPASKKIDHLQRLDFEGLT
jgi:hypothetical protein